MILLLDSTRGSDLRVGVANGQLRTRRRKFPTPVGATLLGLVVELLQRQRLPVGAVAGIIVASGPGPFSALRSACAIANALAFALSVPAVGVRGALTMRQLLERGRRKLRSAKRGRPVTPFYGRPPNITQPKRKR